MVYGIYVYIGRFITTQEAGEDTATAMADVIKLQYAGRIATITIDNDKKLNALGFQGYYAIAKALREIAARDDIYITVLTGKGRYFSA